MYLLFFFFFLPRLEGRLRTILTASQSAENTTIILVANKHDQAEHRQVDEAAIKQLSAEFNCPWFSASARDGTNVNKVFESLLREVEKVQNPPEGSNGTKCQVM